MNADICVIIPTIREYECMRVYFDNARVRGFGLDRLFVLLVTEDFCDAEGMASMLDNEGVSGTVFDGTAREEWYDNHDISEYSHLIPTANHVQTSFGLLYMQAHSEFDYGVFVDDDTLPHDEWDFFGRYMANLDRIDEVESVSSDERWVNALYQSADERGLHPRGYPYSAMDEAVETGMCKLRDVVVSQGLWANVPDLDAVRILMDGDLRGQAQTRTDFDDFDGDFVAEPGQYLTVRSMNLASKREVISTFYQLPMDDNEWKVGHFDDIWSGVFLERAADALGKDIVTGYLLCKHNKAARPTFDDLNNGVPGLEFSEHLWEVVNAAGGDADSYAGVFEAMADTLADEDWSDYRNGDFFSYVGEYMRDWLDCLDALAAPRTAAPADD